MTLGLIISLFIVIISIIFLMTSGFRLCSSKEMKAKVRRFYSYSMVISTIVLFISIPLLINESYKQNLGYITVWEGKDLLAFYGSILTFIGTVFLGALTLYQNKTLSLINNDLVKHQYKPVITISTLVDLSDEKEKDRTYYRIVERNEESILINNGYSSKPIDFINAVLSIKNIGLGPSIKNEIFWYKLKEVEGLNTLDEIEKTNINDFYEKISYVDLEYEDNGKIKNKPWLLYTEFDLGISEDTNRLNLVFKFEENVETLHSIIEIRYENLLGLKYKKLIYLGYKNKKASILPISKEYKI